MAFQGIHPSLILKEELAARGLSAAAFGLKLRVAPQRIQEIVAGRRPISKVHIIPRLFTPANPMTLLAALGMFVLSAGALAQAETIGSSDSSPLLRALHPDVTTDTQIITFHFGDEMYKVPRNYLMGGSDVPRANEPGYFTILVLLPDLSPRTNENQEEFKRLGVGRRLRASLHHDMHLESSNNVLSRFLSNAQLSELNSSDTSVGLKVFHTALWDVYVDKPNDGSLLLFTTCDFDNQQSYWKSCHVMEQITKEDVLEYYFNKEYVDQFAEIDTRLRELFHSFVK